MRNPNGYGGISNLGGNRRNPFRVRITSGWDYDEKTGKHKQKYSVLGYYPTRKAAMLALAEYNKNPYDIDSANITFKEVYDKWSVRTFPGLSSSATGQYKSSFKKFEKLYTLKMVDIRKKHLQAVFDENSHLTNEYQTKMKMLIRNMFRYCIEYDILQKDYSQFIALTGSGKKESIHKPYTLEEIKLLWDNLELGVPLQFSAKDKRDVYMVDTLLILIYTGMRPGELLKIENEKIFLEDRYMIGGFKSKAGTDRIIPIHEDIYPLIKKRKEVGGKYLVKYKADSPPTMQQYRQYIFDPMMEKLKLEHLPHDGRHTFSTIADSYIDLEKKKRIMGHAIQDITQGTYTHKTAEDLVEMVNKVIFLKK